MEDRETVASNLRTARETRRLRCITTDLVVQQTIVL